MNFALAVAIAISFWGARDVQVPCQPVPVAATDAQLPHQAGMPVTMAATAGCRILLGSEAGEYRHNRDMAVWYCGFVAHEVGHLAGLGHTKTGLMTDGDLAWESVPYDCIHWRKYARQHHIPPGA